MTAFNDRNIEDTSKFISQLFANATSALECCFEGSGPLFKDSSMFDAFAQVRHKNLKTRLLIEITKDNMPRCKELMKYADLYHLVGTKGNFLIVDGAHFYYMTNDKHSPKLLTTNEKSFVETQQFLFDSLLNRAISAKDKIKEIEKGVEREFIETIRDPQEILKLALNLVQSASYEILVLFSTISSFYRAETDGITEALGEASKRDVKVRVLVKVDDDVMKDVSKQKIKEKHEHINVQFIRQLMRTRITTIIIDQTFSLTIEVKDDTQDEFTQATGLATYSNSESTVYSNVSMFESLWIRSELDRQNRIKQAYFQLFKSQKLRDENYNRKWSLGESNDQAE